MKFTMKKLVLACALVFPMVVQAEMLQSVAPVKLTNATVFLKGAELSSEISVTIPQGESEVVLSNVAGNIDPQTLSVFADNNVLVLSSMVARDYLEEEVVSSDIQVFQEKIEFLKAQQTIEEIKRQTIAATLDVINNSKGLERTKEKALSVAELTELVALVESKMQTLLTDQADVKKNLDKIATEIRKLEQQVQQEKSKGVIPGARVKVKLYAKEALTTNLRLSYVVDSAGWMPTYDIYADKVNAPINLMYKAKLFQNTGIDWDNVSITLSTGNPARNATVPNLRPWYLDVDISRDINISTTSKSKSMSEYSNAYMGDVVMESKELQVPVPRRELQSSLAGYVTTNAEGINTQYKIDIPYTIPSDGQGHMIFIQSTELAADYHYVSVPKLDSNVYLQATINNWQNLNLLPGQTNLYFENSYVGQSHLAFNKVEEGLSLSLGVENRIIVKREEDKKKGSAGFFGGNAERKLAYTIKVSNARPDAIQFKLIDQLPVSQNEQIKFLDMQFKGAKHDVKTGEIIWETALKPNENRTFEYNYKIRYPKDLSVMGL